MFHGADTLLCPQHVDRAYLSDARAGRRIDDVECRWVGCGAAGDALVAFNANHKSMLWYRA